jgi:hypothetical protein
MSANAIVGLMFLIPVGLIFFLAWLERKTERHRRKGNNTPNQHVVHADFGLGPSTMFTVPGNANEYQKLFVPKAKDKGTNE